MSDTLSLLSLDDDLALQVIVQEALIPGVLVSDLQSSTPTFDSQNNVLTTISSKEDKLGNNTWPYKGQVTFKHHRLDIGVVFGNLSLQFILPFPTNTAKVVQKLNLALGINLTANDYIPEEIAPITNTFIYNLKLSNSSRRWSGNIDITLLKQLV